MSGANDRRPRASGRLTRLLEGLAAVLEARDPPAPPAAGPAFCWDGGVFRPVRRRAAVDPGLLTGVDRQKEAFYANVRRFLAEVPCHDVLLWGERGTGKSSLVRCLLGWQKPESG
ncbi:MAG: DUF815 domain-containing protein, partial [Deltaproteobacteria bacterium]|nr:DUF815 domain-containing protein [Deltaproteobacteria bacterium]